MSAGTPAGSGGTKSAPQGVWSLPPIQFCSVRTWPAMAPGWPAVSAAWTARIPLTAEALGDAGLLDGELHRVDVGEHLAGVGPDAAAGVAARLRPGEAAWVGLEALDLGRRDRLGAQQQAGEGVERAGSGRR